MESKKLLRRGLFFERLELKLRMVLSSWNVTA
jgi:hypothetical protein